MGGSMKGNRSKPATPKELITMLEQDMRKQFIVHMGKIAENKDRIRELEKPGSTTKYWLKQ